MNYFDITTPHSPEEWHSLNVGDRLCFPGWDGCKSIAAIEDIDKEENIITYFTECDFVKYDNGSWFLNC